MTPGKKLRRAIEGCELPHPRFAQLAKQLAGRIDDAISGFEPRIECVLGATRVGKSALIAHLQRLYPEPKVEGGRQVPVLVAKVSSGVSWQMLPRCVIKALGVPAPRAGTKSGELTAFLRERLKSAGTRALIFEEASHLVDQGSRIPPRAAGDWFKEIADECRLTVLMFGVPRLERLIKSNEQLEERASAPLEFRPYDSRIEEELLAFAACVRAYMKIFEKFEFPFTVTFTELCGQCYLQTGGRIGTLSKFMQELATQLQCEAPRSVTLVDCRATAAAVGFRGHPDWRPFVGQEASPVALAAAHAHVLTSNGMSVRVLDGSGAGQ